MSGKAMVRLEMGGSSILPAVSNTSCEGNVVVVVVRVVKLRYRLPLLLFSTFYPN